MGPCPPCHFNAGSLPVAAFDLARATGVKPQEVTRILELHHATKIDTLADAFDALGYRLDLKVSKAKAAA